MSTPQTVRHDPEEIEALAITLRSECLSGYTWNVPATWEEAHWCAKDAWRARSVAFLDAQSIGVSRECSTCDK
jgi:hypothetical protein